jgi:uncharacterized integral membrane protein
MNDKEKRIIEKSNNSETPEDFEFYLLKKKYDRKWVLAKWMSMMGTILLLYLMVVIAYKHDKISSTISLWTILIPLIFGAIGGYINIKALNENKDKKE